MDGMQVQIIGVNPPGRAFCRPNGSAMENVHVGVQIRRDPAELVRADVAEAQWELEVDVVTKDGIRDFRGPAVQGKRGERFLYLTWVNVGPHGESEMFRRAKLMLNRVDEAVMSEAVSTGGIRATVELTAEDGSPRCARVDPPAISWSASQF